MTTRKTVRLAASIFSIPLISVLGFNVENLATRLGWGNVLADSVAPRGRPSAVLGLLHHPALLWVSLFGLGIVAGLWIDSLLLRRDRVEREGQGNLFSLMQNAYGRMDQLIADNDGIYRADIAGEIDAIFRKLDKQRIRHPSLNWADVMDSYRVTNHYLGRLMPMVRDGDISFARRDMLSHLEGMKAIAAPLPPRWLLGIGSRTPL